MRRRCVVSVGVGVGVGGRRGRGGGRRRGRRSLLPQRLVDDLQYRQCKGARLAAAGLGRLRRLPFCVLRLPFCYGKGER